MKSRPYQFEALLKFFQELYNHSSALVVMPTGTGKGFVIGQSVKLNPFPGRTLVIVHREEIVFQLAKHIADATGEQPEIEMAQHRARNSQDIKRKQCVVASIQTICKSRRLKKFDPKDFGLIIVDEGHHASAPIFRHVINHFKQNPAIKVGGFTATPNRSDKITLGCIYDCVAFNYPILDAINDGYLVPIDQQYVHVNGLDLDTVRVVDGDLSRLEMDAIISRDEIMMSIVDATIKIANDRKTLLFATSVYAAEKASSYFCAHEPDSAVCLSQKTKRDNRREILRLFRAGDFTRLCNCNLFTEGYDDPSIQVVSLARKTKSGLVYSQMVGRGLRPYPGGVVDAADCIDHLDRKQAIANSPKPKCTVIDFYGNASRHKLVSMPDLLCGDWPEDIIEQVKEELRKQSSAQQTTDIIEEMTKKLEEEKEKEVRKRAKLVADAMFTASFVSPFDENDAPVTFEPPSDRSPQPPSEKMKKRLAAWGVDCDKDKISFNQAKDMITEMINRHERGMSTYRQCKFLAAKNVDAKQWSMERASTAMDLFLEKKITKLPDLGKDNWTVGMLDKGGAALFINDKEQGKIRLSRSFQDVKEAQAFIGKVCEDRPAAENKP